MLYIRTRLNVPLPLRILNVPQASATPETYIRFLFTPSSMSSLLSYKHTQSFKKHTHAHSTRCWVTYKYLNRHTTAIVEKVLYETYPFSIPYTNKTAQFNPTAQTQNYCNLRNTYRWHVSRIIVRPTEPYGIRRVSLHLTAHWNRMHINRANRVLFRAGFTAWCNCNQRRW